MITLLQSGIDMFAVLLIVRFFLFQGAFDDVMKWAGYASTFLLLGGGLITVIYWFVKGKDASAAKDTIAELKDVNEARKIKIVELEHQKRELLAQYQQVKRVNIQLKKANLRLQGIDDEHHADESGGEHERDATLIDL